MVSMEDQAASQTIGRGSLGISAAPSYSSLARQEGEPAKVPWLRLASSQNIVVGLIALCCPGIFNAMQGLGNAGGDDSSVASAMNACLYLSFAVFGFAGGLLFNLFGNKALLFFGGLTYIGYALGVYLWGIDEAFAWVAIAAAALLGLGAACFWTAQGAMTVSYAMDNERGTFTSTFWVIFNVGGMMGGLLVMALQWQGGQQHSISPVTYFTFCGLMLLGSVMAIFLVKSPGLVVRKDGKRVVMAESAGPLSEASSALAVFMDKRMLLLAPLIVQSNWFYTYEFNGVNGLLFNPRTRGLNSAVFWGMQMVSSLIVGRYVLDSPSMGLRRRAMVGLALVAGFNLVQWIYAAWAQYGWTAFYDYQHASWVYQWDKDNKPADLTGPPLGLPCDAATYEGANVCIAGALYGPRGSQLIDISEFSRWWVPGLLFFCMGLADAAIQTYAYWVMGSIADDPATLSRYVGFYKGVQALGAAAAWALDLTVTYRVQMWICLILGAAFPLPAALVASSLGKES